MAVPGWYQDPNDPRTFRWWDGERWTEYTQPQPGAPSAQAVPGYQSGYQNAQYQGAAPGSNGQFHSAITGEDVTPWFRRKKILLAGVAVLVLLVGLVVLRPGNGDKPLSPELQQAATTAVRDQLAKQGIDAEIVSMECTFEPEGALFPTDGATCDVTLTDTLGVPSVFMGESGTVPVSYDPLPINVSTAEQALAAARFLAFTRLGVTNTDSVSCELSTRYVANLIGDRTEIDCTGEKGPFVMVTSFAGFDLPPLKTGMTELTTPSVEWCAAYQGFKNFDATTIPSIGDKDLGDIAYQQYEYGKILSAETPFFSFGPMGPNEEENYGKPGGSVSGDAFDEFVNVLAFYDYPGTDSPEETRSLLVKAFAALDVAGTELDLMDLYGTTLCTQG